MLFFLPGIDFLPGFANLDFFQYVFFARDIISFFPGFCFFFPSVFFIFPGKHLFFALNAFKGKKNSCRPGSNVFFCPGLTFSLTPSPPGKKKQILGPTGIFRGKTCCGGPPGKTNRIRGQLVFSEERLAVEGRRAEQKIQCRPVYSAQRLVEN